MYHLAKIMTKNIILSMLLDLFYSVLNVTFILKPNSQVKLAFVDDAVTRNMRVVVQESLNVEL